MPKKFVKPLAYASWVTSVAFVTIVLFAISLIDLTGYGRFSHTFSVGGLGSMHAPRDQAGFRIHLNYDVIYLIARKPTSKLPSSLAQISTVGEVEELLHPLGGGPFNSGLAIRNHSIPGVLRLGSYYRSFPERPDPRVVPLQRRVELVSDSVKLNGWEREDHIWLHTVPLTVLCLLLLLAPLVVSHRLRMRVVGTLSSSRVVAFRLLGVAGSCQTRGFPIVTKDRF